jgi:hypothetical protein
MQHYDSPGPLHVQRESEQQMLVSFKHRDLSGNAPESRGQPVIVQRVDCTPLAVECQGLGSRWAALLRQHHMADSTC